jgi:hypothetical protein
MRIDFFDDCDAFSRPIKFMIYMKTRFRVLLIKMATCARGYEYNDEDGAREALTVSS